MVKAGSRGPCRGYQPLTLYNVPKRITVRFRSTSAVSLPQRKSGHAFRPMLAAPFRSALTQVPSADLYRPRWILFPEAFLLVNTLDAGTVTQIMNDLPEAVDRHLDKALIVYVTELSMLLPEPVDSKNQRTDTVYDAQ